MAAAAERGDWRREHDCSTWDEMYENEENEAATAWNAPPKAKGSSRMIAMSPSLRLPSPRLPMLWSPARRLSFGRLPRALSSDRTVLAT